MWPSINFHYNLWRPRLAPNPLVLSVTGGNFSFLTARKKPADVGSPDHCGPRLYQFHTGTLLFEFSFLSFFFSLLMAEVSHKCFSNISTPVALPVLVSSCQPGPSKACQSPQRTGTASLAWWGVGVRSGAHGSSESVSKWEQRWSLLSTLQPGCRAVFLTSHTTGFLFRTQDALRWEPSEASV